MLPSEIIACQALPLAVPTAFTPYIPLGKGGRSKGMVTIIRFGQIRSDLPPHPLHLATPHIEGPFETP